MFSLILKRNSFIKSALSGFTGVSYNVKKESGVFGFSFVKIKDLSTSSFVTETPLKNRPFFLLQIKFLASSHCFDL